MAAGVPFGAAVTVGRVLMTVGGLLQLLGIVVIFVEIRETERLLRLRSWWRRTASDVGRFVSSILPARLRRGHTVVVKLAGDVAGVSDGSARLTVVPAEGTTVDERLDSHRRQLAALREELQRVQQRLDQDQAEGRAALSNVETRLRTELASVRQLVGGSQRRIPARARPRRWLDPRRDRANHDGGLALTMRPLAARA